MPRQRIVAPLIVMTLVALTTTNGCDDGAALVAREAADRQARQNETMAHLQGKVAAGTKRLVEEEGKARQHSFELQRGLQTEQSQLGKGWNNLEAQRQSIAGDRRTQSFLIALVTGGGGVLAGLLALAFAAMTLFGFGRRDDSAQIACELLVEDLVADEPRLMPRSLTSPDAPGRLPSTAHANLGSSPTLGPPDPP